MFKWIFFGLFASTNNAVKCQVLREPVPDKLVVLTFDDAVKSHYTTVAPLLKQYGFGATFFVCEFPPDFGDTTKYMSWAQIKQLSDMGFEIGNHTQTHVDVDKVSKEKLNEELEYIEQKCISLGIPKPVSFAYPGYITHPPALETLEQRGYLFARIGGNKVYDANSEHPFLVPGFTSADTNRTAILKAFREAKNGKIAVITFHGVPDSAHPWVTTPPELFREYLRFLHDNKFKVVAMKDLLKYVDVHRAVKEIKPVFPQKPFSKRTLASIAATIAACIATVFIVARQRKNSQR